MSDVNEHFLKARKKVLWINILMDGPPAQSLGVEPADRELVLGKPRPRHLKLLNRGLATRVLINAFLVSSDFYLKLIRAATLSPSLDYIMKHVVISDKRSFFG